MNIPLTFPVMVRIERDLSGKIVPVFGLDFELKGFLAAAGITMDELKLFDRNEFMGFLHQVIAHPAELGIAGFVVNPNGPDLKSQMVQSPPQLLLSLIR